MRFAIGVRTRWNDPDGLPFQHRKRQAREVQDNVADIAVTAFIRQAIITLNLRLGRLAEVIHIDRRFRGARRGLRLAARAFMRFRQERRHGVVQRVEIRVAVVTFRDLFLLGQFVPAVLVVQRIGLVYNAPFVNRTGGADRDTIHAKIAL